MACPHIRVSSVVSGWVVPRIQRPIKGRPSIGVQSPAYTPDSGTFACDNRYAFIPEHSWTWTYEVDERADARPNLSSWKFPVWTSQVMLQEMSSHWVKYCWKYSVLCRTLLVSLAYLMNSFAVHGNESGSPRRFTSLEGSLAFEHILCEESSGCRTLAMQVFPKVYSHFLATAPQWNRRRPTTKHCPDTTQADGIEDALLTLLRTRLQIRCSSCCCYQTVFIRHKIF